MIISQMLIDKVAMIRANNRETFQESLARNKRIIVKGREQFDVNLKLGIMIIDLRKPLPKSQQRKNRKKMRVKHKQLFATQIDWKEYLKVEEAWMKK